MQTMKKRKTRERISRALLSAILVGTVAVAWYVNRELISERESSLDFADSVKTEKIAEETIVVGVDDNLTVRFYQGDETVFGYSEAEVIGVPLDKLIPAEMVETHNKKARRRFEQTIREGKEFRLAIECTIVRKDGTTAEVQNELRIFPQPTERGIRGIARIRRAQKQGNK